MSRLHPTKISFWIVAWYLRPGDRIANVANTLTEHSRCSRLRVIKWKCKCWKNVKNAAPALMQEAMIRHSWDTCRQSRRWVMEWLPPPNLAMRHFPHNDPQDLSDDFNERVNFLKWLVPDAGLWLCWGWLLLSPVTNIRCCPEPGSEDLLHHSVSSGQVLEQKSLYKLSKCLTYNRIILNKIQNLHCKPQPL